MGSGLIGSQSWTSGPPHLSLNLKQNLNKFCVCMHRRVSLIGKACRCLLGFARVAPRRAAALRRAARMDPATARVSHLSRQNIAASLCAPPRSRFGPRLAGRVPPKGAR